MTEITPIRNPIQHLVYPFASRSSVHREPELEPVSDTLLRGAANADIPPWNALGLGLVFLLGAVENAAFGGICGVWEQRLLQHNLRNRCVVLNHAPNMGLKTLQ